MIETNGTPNARLTCPIVALPGLSNLRKLRVDALGVSVAAGASVFGGDYQVGDIRADEIAKKAAQANQTGDAGGDDEGGEGGEQKASRRRRRQRPSS